MRRFIGVVAIVTVLLTVSVGLSKNAQVGLPALMHYFYGTLIQLRPYMVSLEEFKDDKNRQALRGLLRDLETKIDEHQPQEIQKSPGFNMTYPLMSRHIRDIVHLYDAGVYEHAWQKLNGTTTFCLACHTRLPKKIESQPFEWAKKGANIKFAQNLTDAEFHFISHNYNHALEIFDQTIAKHSNPDEMGELKKIYQKKLYYFVRVARDPDSAIRNLRKDAKNEKLPTEIKDHLKTWISGFEKLKSTMKADAKRKSDKALVEKIQTIVSQQTTGRPLALGDPYLIDMLYASGLLYERLYKGQESPQVPEMLFLLGKLEQEIAAIRYYSVSDVYFKECITTYPKSPVAKKCFQEYSLSMQQRYRGTTPEFVTNSIEALRKIVEGE